MSGRHQPEEGADSEDLTQQDMPAPNIETVMAHLRSMGIPTDQLATEANKVLMADALGRAIHLARRAEDGSKMNLLDSCYAPDGRAFYNQEGCDCEDIALELVSRMTAKAVVDRTKLVAIPGVGLH